MMVKVLLFTILCYQSCAEIIQTQTDHMCELILDTKILFIPANETWSSSEDPCVVYKCLKTFENENKIEIEKIECNITCPEDYVYKNSTKDCCGSCYATFCMLDDVKHKIGSIWKSDNNCTVNECVYNSDEPYVTSYKKSCPKINSCELESIEVKDCCPYCNSMKSMRKNLPLINEVKLTNRDKYRLHPCLRECVEGQELTCYYEFVVENFQTMSKACYNCPSNMTDCYKPHCIPADGMMRSITVVNRMMPGPNIEVCVNDTIIVDVKNHLMSEGTSIHWHGLHQRNTPYMDGVPQITQCAIPVGQIFRYTFRADNSGTHFWHSHLGMQRGDGVYGAIIVRKAEELNENLYDYDLSDHILITIDWTHLPATSIFTSHHHSGGSNKPPNILINGRGKYFGNLSLAITNNDEMVPTTTESFEEFETTFNIENVEETTTESINQDEHQEVINRSSRSISGAPAPVQPPEKLGNPSQESILVPFEVFNVVKGFRYRFRHINAGFLNCPIQLSIDNHTITVISSDGNALEPVEATFLTTYAGERWDFIVNANQEVGNYFIRARGGMDCDERFTSAFQMAVLHYQGAPEEDPKEKPSYDMKREGLALNSLNTGSGQETSITAAELKSYEKKENKILKPEPDYKFFISYDFYGKDNPLFHVENLYGFNQVEIGRIYTPQLNHITMQMPAKPAMLAKGLLDSTFCNESSLLSQGINCREVFCHCTHVLQVPLNAVVEMILVDEGFTYDANHMFHLHGNYFNVIGMDRLGTNVTIQEVKELDRMGRLRRKLIDSPQKDTVTVPDGGYTIIRFYTDNPGMWFLHCHIDFHAEVGMAMMLKIGDYSEMPSPPKNFPTCFDVSSDEDREKRSNSNSLKFSIFLLFIQVLLY
ncbi:CLUMA_CG015286, isoform A [Clunio marinus]|uniref:CLUMA_CG015286, isoform A n=1 Tax=Clunio marinus TaxID=568069 RepID=A0A1J1IU81_9DIPT|nr:CLUMA_CG015286, isoform A [Clunio marinus]